MRCLTTSPAGTSTWTPASFRIDSTAGSVVAVTAGSRWVRSSTRLTGTASSIEMGTPLPMGAPRALTPAPSAWTNTSRLPFGPGTGESAVPSTRPPVASMTSMTPRTASSRAASSRTTPPDPTRARPTSNCGLTITMARQPRARQGTTAPQTVPIEMKERSHVTKSGAHGRSPGARWRALVRSMTVTRGSWRSPQSSWP